MANEKVNKVVYDGTTLIDLTSDTVAANKLLSGYTAHDASGAQITGTYDGIDMPVFTLTFDANWDVDTLSCNKTFSECANYIVDDNNISAYIYSAYDDPQDPWSEENPLISISFSETRIIYTGFYGAAPGFDVIYNSDGTIDYVSPSALVSGLEATSNGTYYPTAYINIPGVYSYVTVNVPSGGTYQAKTNISPTTSSQTITPDSGYDALSSVQINAMPSGTAGTPTVTRGNVSNHSVSFTPSVTNTTGYIIGSTKTGTALTVSASELVSGTYTVDSSGTKDVTNYASASVPAGTATAPSSISGSSATVSTGTNTLTLSKTVSVTPNVSTAGYVSSGTAGNSSVSLTASVTTKGATTYTPTTTNQTIASGTYLTGTQTISGDSNLVASNILSGKTIFGVSGSVTFATYYVSSSNPSGGNNGDIWLKTVS